jgi:hypothetical protein
MADMQNDFKGVIEGEDGNVDPSKMPPIIRANENGDVITGGAEPAGEGAPTPELQFVDDEEVRYVLTLLFDVHGWYYKHEHWTDEEALSDIEMMVPAAVAWINRIPFMVAAVKHAKADSFPLMFLYAWGKRFIASRRLRKAEKMKSKGETMSVGEAMHYGNHGSDNNR